MSDAALVRETVSTAETLLLKNNTTPVAVIYMGGPSAGKTTATSMLERAVVFRSRLAALN